MANRYLDEQFGKDEDLHSAERNFKNSNGDKLTITPKPDDRFTVAHVAKSGEKWEEEHNHKQALFMLDKFMNNGLKESDLTEANKKIDIFHNGGYIWSTNKHKTVKSAVDAAKAHLSDPKKLAAIKGNRYFPNAHSTLKDGVKLDTIKGNFAEDAEIDVEHPVILEDVVDNCKPITSLIFENSDKACLDVKKMLYAKAGEMLERIDFDGELREGEIYEDFKKGDKVKVNHPAYPTLKLHGVVQRKTKNGFAVRYTSDDVIHNTDTFHPKRLEKISEDVVKSGRTKDGISFEHHHNGILHLSKLVGDDMHNHKYMDYSRKEALDHFRNHVLPKNHIEESSEDLTEELGYIGFHGGKQVELTATSLYDAKKKAVAHFKPKKSQEHMVHVHLAQKDGEDVVHAATE